MFIFFTFAFHIFDNNVAKVQIFLWITRKSNFFSNPAREHVFKLLLIHLNTHSVECSCFLAFTQANWDESSKGTAENLIKSQLLSFISAESTQLSAVKSKQETNTGHSFSEWTFENWISICKLLFKVISVCKLLFREQYSDERNKVLLRL